jgi:hypothetical protein
MQSSDHWHAEVARPNGTLPISIPLFLCSYLNSVFLAMGHFLLLHPRMFILPKILNKVVVSCFPCAGGSNTFTLALRVVGGDEKGTQCLGYNRAILFLGDINTGTWPSRLGESQIWDSKIWPWVPGDSDLRMTALTKTSSNCNRQTHPLVREDVTYGL